MSKALQYKQKEIHIYSNSWGPADDGYTVGGPGKFIEMSLEKGARQVRYIQIQWPEDCYYFVVL